VRSTTHPSERGRAPSQAGVVHGASCALRPFAKGAAVRVAANPEPSINPQTRTKHDDRRRKVGSRRVAKTKMLREGSKPRHLCRCGRPRSVHCRVPEACAREPSRPIRSVAPALPKPLSTYPANHWSWHSHDREAHRHGFVAFRFASPSTRPKPYRAYKSKQARQRVRACWALKSPPGLVVIAVDLLEEGLGVESAGASGGAGDD
jgi:hypothetical protein